jgi:hypothetical protein
VPAYRRVLDHLGVAEIGERVMEANSQGRRSEARKLVSETYLDRLAMIMEEDLEAGLARWLPLADRMSLGVPWYGMTHSDQVALARRLLRRLAGLQPLPDS